MVTGRRRLAAAGADYGLFIGVDGYLDAVSKG
jgi:hypothetical protein